MFHKICFICFLLIFVFLYLYVKIDSFTTPNSTQLTSEIARVLSISVRRITNLQYSGDTSSGAINVAFSILEPNPVESANNEKNASDVSQIEQQLFSTGNFKVFINGLSVVLYKIPIPTTDNSIYFNNKNLKEISKYVDLLYTSVPNDASLTNFYKLGFDSNFNITPKYNQ